MSYSLSLFAGAGWQFFDNNGAILSGGKLYTYSAGSTSPLATYTNSSGTSINPNPIILDSAGRVPAEVWVNSSSIAKFVLKTSADVLIGTWDNIPSLVSSLNLTGTNNGVVYFNSVGTFTSGTNLTFDGTNLGVSGATTVGAGLNVAGATALTGNVTASGALSVTGTTTLSGNASVGGTLSVAGNVINTLNVTGTLTTSGTTTLATGSTLTASPASNDSTTKIATTAFCNPAYTAGTNGSVKLPSGLILKWGTASVTIGTSGSINFVSSFATIHNVNATLSYGGASGYVFSAYNPTVSGFSYTWNAWSASGVGNTASVYYTAIGV